MKRVPADGRDSLDVFQFEEEGTRTWHTWLVWHVRELVRFSEGGVVFEGAMWHLDEGERLSWGIDLATTLFRLRMGRYPERALLRTKPKGSPETMRVADGNGECVVAIEAAGWVPEQCVVVR